MTIRIKRIYEPPEAGDGFRVFIDRLWPRGLSKERAHFDVWLKELAPSTELRRWFGHDPEKWEEFKARYFRELNEHPEDVVALAARAAGGTVTLVFGAKAARYSNAAALKEYLEARAFKEHRPIQPLYFYDELRGLIDILNREGIPYAVCGGIAVAFYGYIRTTRDIDVLVREEDIKRISRAVKERGFVFDAGRIPFDTGGPQQREIHRISKILDEETLTLDLLIVDNAYQAIWDDREAGEWQGRRINVVSLEGLLEMKRIAGRSKDLLDIEELTKPAGVEDD